MKPGNSNPTVSVPFDQATFHNLEETSKKMGVSVSQFISQALHIVQMTYGRRLIIKEKNNDIDQWEVKNYRDLPPALPLSK
jgi:SAM-dependent MidA family methyltransferase